MRMITKIFCKVLGKFVLHFMDGSAPLYEVDTKNKDGVDTKKAIIKTGSYGKPDPVIEKIKFTVDNGTPVELTPHSR